MTTQPKHVPVSGDQPIQNAEQDRIGRRGFAAQIRLEIESAPRGDGLVIGVTGPWGSGKTSAINLAVNPLAEQGGYRIVRFNPWLFSGTPQLVDHFFAELSAQLVGAGGLHADAIGRALESYGNAIDPLRFVPGVDKASAFMRLAGGLLRRRPRSVEAQREHLAKLLADSDELLVVVIDDIDRLRDDEVADVMRLVRLVAGFPNTVYVVAFDVERVAAAIGTRLSGEENKSRDGHAYIEKIVQVSHEIPLPSGEQLSRLTLERLEQALDGIAIDVSRERWSGLYLTIRRYIRTPRDVGRYGNHVRAPAAQLHEEVAGADLLALEALRVFERDLWQRLHSLVPELTSLVDEPSPFMPHRPKPDPERLARAFDDAVHPELARDLVRQLFPAAARRLGDTAYGGDAGDWRRHKRVASENVLNVYLAKQIEVGHVPASVVESVIGALDDREALVGLTSDLTPEQLADLLGRLEAFEGDFPQTVAPAVEVLYSLVERLPPREGFLGIDQRMRVGRVVLRVLRGRAQDEVAAIAEDVYEALSLSDRWDLVRSLGYVDGAGHGLVSQADAESLEQRVYADVIAADADALGAERDLSLLLGMAGARDLPALRKRVRELVGSDAFLLALIAKVRQEVRSGDGGRSIQLNWDTLIELVGDEKLLIGRIKELPVDLVLEDPDAEFLLGQARRYSDDPKVAAEEMEEYRKRYQ